MSQATKKVLDLELSTAEPDARSRALQVESARQTLADQLLSNTKVAAIMAKQLLLDLSNGLEYSDVVLIKQQESYKDDLRQFVSEFSKPDIFTGLFGECSPYSLHKAVQQKNVVQVGHFNRIDSQAINEWSRTNMQRLHFLPLYLMRIAERVEKELSDSDDYVRKVKRARTELKKNRQLMIAENTGLVAFVAHKYKTVSLTFDDLMQEGLVGLIKAVDRFDTERGHCFSTYSIFWIKQAISRLIVKQDKIVALPVALAEKSAPIFEAMRISYTQQERWPTLKELKTCCDLSEQDIRTISSYYQSAFLQDANAEEDDGMAIMERMSQEQFNQPIDDLIDNDLVCYMNKAVEALPEKQATILAMRFGLKNHTEMTLQAVADQLNVTRERVRQIQNEALARLKQQFGFDLMLFLEPNDT